MNNLFVERKHEHDVSVYQFFVNECVELFYAISVSYVFVIYEEDEPDVCAHVNLF